MERIEIEDEKLVAAVAELAEARGIDPWEMVLQILREHLGLKPVRYRSHWRGEGRGQAWRKWIAEEVWELRRQGFVCRFAENHRTEAK